MSKESDKIAEVIENMSITFDELGFSPTIPIPKGDKAHFIDWFKFEIDEIKAVSTQQDQRISELEEQLKNVIVLPKELKIGDTVFYVDEDGVLKGKVVSVIRELNLLENGFVDWFYCVYEEGLTFHHLIGDVGTKLFATKEEAQAKLEELKGE